MDIKKIKINMNNMSGISKNLLIIGQSVLVLILAALVFYIIRFNRGGDHTEFYYVYINACTLLDNIAAGQCLLWGGAFFIDYLEKSGERVR